MSPYHPPISENIPQNPCPLQRLGGLCLSLKTSAWRIEMVTVTNLAFLCLCVFVRGLLPFVVKI
jgi:hypothetical protein